MFVKLHILTLTAMFTASAASAAGPELNSYRAPDVNAVMADAAVSMPAAPSRFIKTTPVPGQTITVQPGAELMWVTDPEAAGMGGVYGWSAADAACKKLDFGGYSDWELPTEQELLGLVDAHFQYPSIDKEYFPNTGTGYYWTATDFPENSFFRRVYTVSFSKGGLYYATVMANKYNVRCVRRGASYYKPN